MTYAELLIVEGLCRHGLEASQFRLLENWLYDIDHQFAEFPVLVLVKVDHIGLAHPNNFTSVEKVTAKRRGNLTVR
jgi:hypothetical protein